MVHKYHTQQTCASTSSLSITVHYDHTYMQRHAHTSTHWYPPMAAIWNNKFVSSSLGVRHEIILPSLPLYFSSASYTPGMCTQVYRHDKWHNSPGLEVGLSHKSNPTLNHLVQWDLPQHRKSTSAHIYATNILFRRQLESS